MFVKTGSKKLFFQWVSQTNDRLGGPASVINFRSLIVD